MVKDISITDMYMSVLSSLTADEKLDLISKLSESLRKTKKEKKVAADPFACYKGDWDDNLPRTFTRKVKSW
ncbi:hypothetical protein [Parabacteroides hominis]|jgi:hypothetical protein|uniref:Uncharacterized protein n=1 Tax=Parabacteroides hominis TaxID=2763057 RepID=A0ABR7DLQ4_9BACT|nr:hypothetical protein [Parabacteroides hominis]MBC5632030.1 hypothetical protein [Parabacteroides hominis]MBD9167849.1 hypothetical protein [Parabacteroides johnsonii]